MINKKIKHRLVSREINILIKKKKEKKREIEKKRMSRTVKM